MIRTGRIAAASLLSFCVVVAASGWLYIIQPRSPLPGPPVTDALPLDELSRRSAVPLLVFVGVWSAAALSLGLVARIMRAERLTAGLMLALGVGGWGYLQTGLSLLIVRQIPAQQAFHAAAGQKAVYLPATLAGLAGALGGRARTSERPRSPLVLAWFVAAAGTLGVIEAVTPDHRSALIAALAPENVHGVSEALVAPLGLMLLVAARGLARRKHRAWQISVVVLLWLVALHLQHRFGYGAIATGLVAVALLARRADFDAQGDASANPRVALRAFLFGTSIFGYAFIALWLNRVMADQPFTLSFALRETVRGAVGANATGSSHLSGSFGEWFPLSVLLLTVCAAGLLLFAWLAPWRYRHAQEARHRLLTRDLVATWGVDTLAPFVLRADKSYFFDDEEAAFLAYKVVSGIAIVSGDPIGPPERFPGLVGSFLRFAHARGWRVAILGVSEDALDLYRGHGLHALYHGDEAVVDTSTFSLEGRPVRKVRQSVHRVERSGYTATAIRPSAIGRASDGSVAGFLHFALCRPGSALSLSSMPRLRDTPNGFNEWLVCAAIDWARDEGIERVSLNFAPFAALLAPEAELSKLQRLERHALLRLKGHFQLDNLLLFNRKFFPEWQRRFVVYEKRLDLPRVGIAALAAEAYLPFSGRERP